MNDEKIALYDFKKEKRYHIIKVKDAEAYLTKTERDILKALMRKIYKKRSKEKKDLQCVVVESDWPEYEKVWAMLAERMASNKHDWKMVGSAGMYDCVYMCAKCKKSHRESVDDPSSDLSLHTYGCVDV